jgi:hypothetical protein
MKRSDGYITTYLKDNETWRIKISTWLAREGNGTKVKVREYSEHLTSSNYWQKEAPSGPYQQMILDEISEKLYKKK